MVESFRDPGAGLRLALVDISTLQRKSGWFIALGVAFGLLGLLAMFLPLAASLVTTVTLGWLLMVAGVMEGYHALQNWPWPGAAWELLSAVVQVAAGILVVVFPVAGTMALTLILAGYFVAEGCLKLIRAAQHRRMAGVGWLVFDGLVSLALGVMMLLHWPSVAVWTLGLFVGINLVIGGFSMLLIGMRARAPLRA